MPPRAKPSVRVGRRVLLRFPRETDRDEFLEMVRKSRRFHRPWVYPPADEQRFRNYVRHANGHRNQAYLVCRRKGGEIIGGISLSEIVYGVLQSAYLGYYGHALHSGDGLMTEAVRLSVTHAFRSMKLHRVEANIQPENVRSIALAERCGFRKEGYSPRYLKIGGRWRDHARWAVLAEDWK